METYKNLSGNSGVAAYEIGHDYIDIRFQDGTAFRYDEQHTGKEHVEQMKALAAAGRGLNTYINRHVRMNYAKKLD
jgi:hypothetical protein